MKDKHTIRMKVLNTVGVMARITGLISQRGYNIDSIIATPSEADSIYTVHLVLTETEEKIEQISKQLNKLIDVLKVTDISHNNNYIVREFIMVKISTSRNRHDLLQIIGLFRAKVLDLASNYVVVSITGSPRKISRFIEAVQPFGIQELDRSGEFAVLDIQH
ncbi:MAG: acetolactate synthase small subunit [Candidatus Marinimicrobia bacterium]|nr:acetolactate synthase small subunit [Candidatus Neomarinimicrobiota bacterium]